MNAPREGSATAAGTGPARVSSAPTLRSASAALAADWSRLLPGALLLAAVLLLFRDTATAMVGIWIRSETFAHAFLVPPIVLWLVWRQREELARLTPRAAPWVLLPMAAVCALWVLAELASVNAATQFALVTLLVLSVPAVFGLQVAWALLFPLLFLYFAVPAGEFLVAPMMEWTADFTVAALQMTGVPVLREGLQFIIPTGSWSVVEACSGVRYLIASFMVGTLFAYLNYRSQARRAVFIGVSLAVPVVANWLRAYLIVMVGHLSGNKLAAGVDHIIYGWVFFGVVIGVMFMVGARFAEPDAPAAAPSPAHAGSALSAASAAPGPGAGRRSSFGTDWGVGLAAVLLLAATQALVWRLDRPRDGPPPALSLDIAATAGFSATAGPVSSWQPSYANAVAESTGAWKAADASVGVRVAYYRDQNYARKLVTSTNTLVDQSSEALWAQVASGSATVALAGIDAARGAGVTPAGGGAGSTALAVRTATLRGSPAPGASFAPRLRVWQVYWIGGRYIAGDAPAKLQLAVNRLLGRGDDGAAVFFFTEETPQADAVLERFVAAHAAALSDRLAVARGSR